MKEPPKFNTDRSYERYETEVDAWSSITPVAKAKQGTLLVLSLPDSRKHEDLNGKVMDGCDYKGENGLKNVKEFLKLHIGQDSVSEVVDKIRTFMGATRMSDQTIREYVSNFESSYSLTKSKAGMEELPSLFLMLVLTENTNISEHNKKLVLSGVDLEKPNEIYSSTKKALPHHVWQEPSWNDP